MARAIASSYHENMILFMMIVVCYLLRYIVEEGSRCYSSLPSLMVEVAGIEVMTRHVVNYR